MTEAAWSEDSESTVADTPIPPRVRLVDSSSPRTPFGLMVALEREASALRRGLGLPLQPSSSSSADVTLEPDGALVCGGPGRCGAEAGMTELCLRHRVGLVVSLGFAGGLEEGLAPGDLVAVDRTGLAGAATSERTSPELLELALGLRLPGLRVGSAVTADAVVGTPAAKHSLARASGASVVDMESYWAAAAGRRLGVPVLLLRAVSDPVDQPLPEWMGATGTDGQPRWGALVVGGLRHPRDLRHVPGLWRGVQRAETALSSAVAALLPALREAFS